MKLATVLANPGEWYKTRDGWWHSMNLYGTIREKKSEESKNSFVLFQEYHAESLLQRMPSNDEYIVSLRPKIQPQEIATVYFPNPIDSLEHLVLMMDHLNGPKAWNMLEALAILLKKYDSSAYAWMHHFNGTSLICNHGTIPDPFDLFEIIQWTSALINGKLHVPFRFALPKNVTDHQTIGAYQTLEQYCKTAPISTKGIQKMLKCIQHENP